MKRVTVVDREALRGLGSNADHVFYAADVVRTEDADGLAKGQA